MPRVGFASRLTLSLVATATLGVPLVHAAPEPAPSQRPSQIVDARLAELVTPGALTSDQAAARAVMTDPSVRRKDAVTREREANLDATERQRVPQLGASISYTRLSEVDMPELAPGLSIPQVLDNTSFKLELSVPLTDYFLRFPALVETQELRLDAARVDRKVAEQAVDNRARQLYWGWVRAQMRVLVSEQSLTQVQATASQMKARVEAQRASRADLLRIQAQVADVERGLAVARAQVVLAEQRLRQAIAAPIDERLAIGEDVAAPLAGVIPADDLPTLVARATTQRPELRMLELSISALERSRDATRAGLYPRLDAFGTFNYDDPNARVFLSDGGFDATWALGVRLSWKLNDLLAVDPALDATQAQIRQLRDDKESLVRQLELAIADALTSARVAQANHAATLEAKQAAEESYRIRAELLANDRATAVELVDAESELTRVRVQEVDALIDLRLALANLRYALGETP